MEASELETGCYDVFFYRGKLRLRDLDSDVNTAYLAKLSREGVGPGVTAVAVCKGPGRGAYEMYESGEWRRA